jgi:large subunit ribosomal protein L4
VFSNVLKRLRGSALSPPNMKGAFARETMAVVSVFNSNAEKVSEAELADAIFNVPVKSSVLHEVVTMQLANRRAGTAAVKHRADIHAGGRKLFRQKGTGRARRGDIKSPLLRGGGSVFGPDPKSFAYKVPKKVRRLALKMALSVKLQSEDLMVLDAIPMDEVKTKAFVGVLDTLGLSNVLIITDGTDDQLALSSRNVPKVKVMPTEGLNVYDILKFEKLVLLEPSIKKIEGRLLS